jgi:hypothetical protein
LFVVSRKATVPVGGVCEVNATVAVSVDDPGELMMSGDAVTVVVVAL